jgi:hypothetical protein
VAALVGLVLHGGFWGAAVEASAALLIVAIALAVWVGNRKGEKEQ